MNPIIPLLIIGAIGICIAIYQDLKTREISNWFNLGMIILVLIYRIGLTLITGEEIYFVWGLTGIGAGLLISLALYYCGLFGGGDGKMLIWIMGIMPMTTSPYQNTWIMYGFIMLLVILTLIYRLVAFYCRHKNESRPLPLAPVFIVAYILTIIFVTLR